MKFAVAVLLFFALLGLRGGEENPPVNQPLAPSLGLEVGQKAPVFALPDQFGHQQSNDALKGSQGTILLFFRSADW